MRRERRCTGFGSVLSCSLGSNDQVRGPARARPIKSCEFLTAIVINTKNRRHEEQATAVSAFCILNSALLFAYDSYCFRASRLPAKQQENRRERHVTRARCRGGPCAHVVSWPSAGSLPHAADATHQSRTRARWSLERALTGNRQCDARDDQACCRKSDLRAHTHGWQTRRERGARRVRQRDERDQQRDLGRRFCRRSSAGRTSLRRSPRPGTPTAGSRGPRFSTESSCVASVSRPPRFPPRLPAARPSRTRSRRRSRTASSLRPNLRRSPRCVTIAPPPTIRPASATTWIGTRACFDSLERAFATDRDARAIEERLIRARPEGVADRDQQAREDETAECRRPASSRSCRRPG